MNGTFRFCARLLVAAGLSAACLATTSSVDAAPVPGADSAAIELVDTHLEDVEGVAVFEIASRKLEIVLEGKSIGFGNVGEISLQVAGPGDGESNSKRTTFKWNSHYLNGVLKLDLDGYKLQVEDRGRMVIVGARKFKIDGTLPIKLTLRADGMHVVEPKDAEIK